ncbi:MAG: Rossmann-like domain-containing protein [Thiolinea sp.]
MSISQDLFEHGSQMLRAFPQLNVSGLVLPTPGDKGFCDEFGFIMLNSGAIGPFYVSLDDTLLTLWQRFPTPEVMHVPLEELLTYLTTDSLPERALGIGAYNALSRHVMNESGYQPAKRRNKTDTQQESGAVGMVGYFGPLIERLIAQKRPVIVLEKLAARVKPHPLVRHVTRPDDLADCEQVLCTASTLVNGTLDEILAACHDVPHFSLVGPSASGLPDACFAHGVDSIGAIQFTDQALVKKTLNAGESWGKAGEKYEINRNEYPGISQLLAQASATASRS